MTLTQFLGDTEVHTIPMRWRGRAFVPGTAWVLKFTVKALSSQTDALRLLQKGYPAFGVTVSGCNAVVTILREDTFRTAPPFEAAEGRYVWDIQAQQVAAPNHTRTVASGTFVLERDVTRLSDFTGPIYTTENPLTLVIGPTGANGADLWLAGGFTSPPPDSGLTTVRPDASWWGRVVDCDYPIGLPSDAENFLGKRFVVRSTAEVPLSNVYIGDNVLTSIPAPIQQFGSTLTLIESIGGVWRATLRYSERPGSDETTATVLNKIKGAVANPSKVGAEYLPDSLSGAGVPTSGMIVSGTLTSNGTDPVVFPLLKEAGVVLGRMTFTDDGSATNTLPSTFSYYAQYNNYLGGSGQWEIRRLGLPLALWRGPLNGGEALPSDVAVWTALGTATGSPTVTKSLAASYIGQPYRNTTANEWYRWNGTAWQGDASSITQFNIDGGTPGSVFGGTIGIDGGTP
jgi:hypothetical protein